MSLAKIIIATFFLMAISPALTAEELKVEAKQSVDTEAMLQDRLHQAQELTAAGKPADAIILIDQVLEHYQKKYPEGDNRWYVARSQQENLRYLLEAALFADKSGGKKDTVVLTVAWAEAFFLKAYAYVELQKTTEAKAAIEQALLLSPQNAKYLTELAEIAKLERNWEMAYRHYTAAESASNLSPPDEKLSELSQAKRGQAFVLIEQGKLDEAEDVLKACLKLDKNDRRAKEELDYIKSLRKKG